MARRHPLRILVAEDNVVNQKLALRLLGQLGYRADVAANGIEAIDAIERQPYEVVLMDVQMPEMDGLESSREINRRWPGDLRPRIVAMTANALQGDRELCLAAGMDDYVAKPIRVEELVAALFRCAPRRGPATPRHGEIPSPEVIDQVTFERLAATAGSGFMGELITTFVEDARDLVGAMRRALPAHDVDGFRRAAHSLKSNAASLGAVRLAAASGELEAKARTGTLDGIEERLERLTRENDEAIRALEALGHAFRE